MKLLKLAGVKIETALDENAKQTLISFAEAFLRAGGQLTLSEWAELEEEERIAFITAGNMIQSETASMIGLACQSEIHALQMMATVDGGNGYNRYILTKKVDEIVDKLKNQTLGEDIVKI